MSLPIFPPSCDCVAGCELHRHTRAVLELAEALLLEHQREKAHSPKGCVLCEAAALVLKKVGAR